MQECSSGLGLSCWRSFLLPGSFLLLGSFQSLGSFQGIRSWIFLDRRRWIRAHWQLIGVDLLQ